MSNHLYDVFISYTHIDNEPFEEGVRGWVSTFVDHLRITTSQKYGNKIKIWDDRGLDGNERVTDTLMETIQASRTLVLFLSPSYQNSHWCQSELAEFLERNTATRNKESVFIVEIEPIDRNNWHARLRELTQTKLYKIKPGTNEAMRYGNPAPNLKGDREYWESVTSVAHLISKHLKWLEGQSSNRPIVLGAPKTTVWVAEPANDVIDEWNWLAESIRQANADLRPVSYDSYDRKLASIFANGVRNDLNNAHLYVQLFGADEGPYPKEGSASYTALQSVLARQSAAQRGIPLLQWRDPDVVLDKISDERYRQLVTGASACGFEEFRKRVLDAAALQRAPPPDLSKRTFPQNAGASGPTVCLSAHRKDSDLGEQVAEALYKLNAATVNPPSDPEPNQSPAAFREEVDALMQDSDGMVIVYGRTPPAWVQAQYQRGKKIFAMKRQRVWGALVDGPPNDKAPAGVRAPDLEVLDCRNGINIDRLKRFIDRLTEVGHV